MESCAAVEMIFFQADMAASFAECLRDTRVPMLLTENLCNTLETAALIRLFVGICHEQEYPPPIITVFIDFFLKLHCRNL